LFPLEGGAAATVFADTPPTEIPEDASARVRFSTVAAMATDEAFSLETVTVVATRRVEARSRRRVNCSVTDAIATLEGAAHRASATPSTYAARADALKSDEVMARVVVNVTNDVHSEHASQGPSREPLEPAEQ
jgi:hypothetical protein